MFVKLHLTMGEVDHGFVLPQAAVARDEKGAYVYVVGKDGKVQERRIDTVYMTRTDWIATGALKDGDQVIVSGLQKVQPGAPAEATLAAAPAIR
jgi:membrane fusion protein (multidrug efflux system)